jgi:hypothetical protein
VSHPLCPLPRLSRCAMVEAPLVKRDHAPVLPVLLVMAVVAVLPVLLVLPVGGARSGVVQGGFRSGHRRRKACCTRGAREGERGQERRRQERRRCESAREEGEK